MYLLFEFPGASGIMWDHPRESDSKKDLGGARASTELGRFSMQRQSMQSETPTLQQQGVSQTSSQSD